MAFLSGLVKERCCSTCVQLFRDQSIAGILAIVRNETELVLWGLKKQLKTAETGFSVPANAVAMPSAAQ